MTEEQINRVAVAIETYGVAYSHATLADMSTAFQKWQVHRITDRFPEEEDVISTHADKASARLACRRLNAIAAIKAMTEPEIPR